MGSSLGVKLLEFRPLLRKETKISPEIISLNCSYIHISHPLSGYVIALLAGLAVGVLHCSITELQAQQRQDVWFQSSNVLSRQVALQDSSLTPVKLKKNMKIRFMNLHGELVKPQPSRESKGEIFLDPNSQLHPAIVFLVGSGPNSTHTGLYTDFVRENLEQIFLQHGVALMYFDKRGLAYLKDVGIAPTYTNGLMMPEPR